MKPPTDRRENGMNRRRFLIRSAQIAGGSLLFPWTRLIAQPQTPDSTSAVPAFPDLVLARGEVRTATHAAVEAIGGMRRFVAPGQVVVVKPNASFECPPDWGGTTHPDVLRGVIEECLEAGARRVLVVDHTMMGPASCFERTGTADAVSEFSDAKLVSLDDEKMYREVSVPAGQSLHKARIPAVLQKADVFINLPTAKSHQSTGVSFGLKNLMGLVWDRHRFHNRLDLHMAIADLATVLRPHLTILDAVRILKTGGPRGPGDVEPFDGVGAGTDPVAMDAYAVGLSTWNGRTYRPNQVAYIRHAEAHGLGTSKLESLTIREMT